MSKHIAANFYRQNAPSVQPDPTDSSTYLFKKEEVIDNKTVTSYFTTTRPGTNTSPNWANGISWFNEDKINYQKKKVRARLKIIKNNTEAQDLSDYEDNTKQKRAYDLVNLDGAYFVMTLKYRWVTAGTCLVGLSWDIEKLNGDQPDNYPDPNKEDYFGRLLNQYDGDTENGKYLQYNWTTSNNQDSHVTGYEKGEITSLYNVNSSEVIGNIDSTAQRGTLYCTSIRSANIYNNPLYEATARYSYDLLTQAPLTETDTTKTVWKVYAERIGLPYLIKDPTSRKSHLQGYLGLSSNDIAYANDLDTLYLRFYTSSTEDPTTIHPCFAFKYSFTASGHTFSIDVPEFEIPRPSKYDNNLVFTKDGLQDFINQIHEYPINFFDVSSAGSVSKDNIPFGNIPFKIHDEWYGVPVQGLTSNSGGTAPEVSLTAQYAQYDDSETGRSPIKIADKFVKKSGDTMTGNLIIKTRHGIFNGTDTDYTVGLFKNGSDNLWLGATGTDARNGKLTINRNSLNNKLHLYGGDNNLQTISLYLPTGETTIVSENDENIPYNVTKEYSLYHSGYLDVSDGDGTNTNSTKLSGILPLAHGGTGTSLTASPSMLTDLSSTTAANILTASPRPGITGKLPITNGGTGTTFKSTNDDIRDHPYAIIRRTSGASTTQPDQLWFIPTANGALYSTGDDQAATFGTLPIEQGGTGWDGKTIANISNLDNTDTNAHISLQKYLTHISVSNYNPSDQNCLYGLRGVARVAVGNTVAQGDHLIFDIGADRLKLYNTTKSSDLWLINFSDNNHTYVKRSGDSMSGILNITNTTGNTTAAPTTSTAALTVSGSGYFAKNLTATKVYNAVFNDYAEYRTTIDATPGHVVVDNDDGSLTLSTTRLQPGAQVISDTYGHCMGETDTAKTPLAVAGRVLVYPYLSRGRFHAGMAVCSAPDGTVDIMTREEIRNYPDCIVGIVSEIPDYEEWGSDNVKVDGRIWIKVK